MHQNKTIYAIATPVGGAIAIIRISGKEAIKSASKLFSGKLEHRYMAYGAIRDDNTILDMAMCCAFYAPDSYTGEDMVELYVHGGAAVVNSVCNLLREIGVCPAEAGEFTKRGFINGKMDLSQAEAVMDLISAISRRSANAAMAQLRGALRRDIEYIEHLLIDALSGINAALDYPDELEEDVFSALPSTLSEAFNRISMLCEAGVKQRVLREGASIVIAGLPNAGKSALMNALLCEDRSIVTPIAGTTRDIIEEQLVIEGIPVRLTDTAGLRETEDIVERIGIERANASIESADLILIAVDANNDMQAELVKFIKDCDEKSSIVILCKSDLEQVITIEDIAAITNAEVIISSASTGYGIETIKQSIAKRLCDFDESSHITNMRHVEALQKAREHVLSAKSSSDADCIATDISMALNALSLITGREVDDEVIDRIFERFCVGK